MTFQESMWNICSKDKPQEVLLKIHVQERIAKSERQKKEKDSQAVAEKQRIINNVIKHGCPVKSIKNV